jgi:hypothetical protein
MLNLPFITLLGNNRYFFSKELKCRKNGKTFFLSIFQVQDLFAMQLPYLMLDYKRQSDTQKINICMYYLCIL